MNLIWTASSSFCVGKLLYTHIIELINQKQIFFWHLPSNIHTFSFQIMFFLPSNVNIFVFQIRKMFTRADKNGDGKLTPEEWQSVLNSSGIPTSREEVEEFFKRMDRDFDGRLSFEVEFIMFH